MGRNILNISLVNLVLRIFIQGMLIVYPIVIQNTGVSNLAIGYFISAMFIASLAGTWLSGKLIPLTFHPKTVLLGTAFPIAVFLALFGQCQTYFPLLFSALGLSFFSGININSSAILLGYFSNHENIGKNFGWLGMSNIASTLLGSVIIGTSLDRFGNKISFILFALVYLISNIIFVWIDKPLIPIKSTIKISLNPDRKLILLLIASLLIIMLIHLFKMSLHLELKKSGYSIKDISYLSALGTLFVLPIPFLLGVFDKYVSSKKILLFCYLLTIAAFIILFLTTKYYAIAVAIAFISILAYGSFIPLTSLLYSWYDKEHLPKAQTYYGSIAVIAAIIGYPLTGLLLENENFIFTVIIGIVIATSASLILLLGVPKQIRQQALSDVQVKHAV